MRLIPEWRRWWRMFSVQAMGVSAALQGAWVLMPEDLKGRLPDDLVAGVSLVLLLAGIAGRLVVQPDLNAEKK